MRNIVLARGKTIDFSRPLVMGVVNCTPDSFAVQCETLPKALAYARQMIDEGADIIDIGGESSRPGSDSVSPEIELKRVLPVIEKIREISDIPISIDTTKAIVAEKALTAGADIINDISALVLDSRMAEVVAKFNCPVVLMHMKGTPRTMQDRPFYDDVVAAVGDFFEERIEQALAGGIARDKLILDVGIGFGKRTEDNLTLIKHLQEFAKYDCPLMVGASRKRFIGELTEEENEKRIDGSLAAAALAVYNGANIVRVHDVAQTRRAIAMATAVREA